MTAREHLTNILERIHIEAEVVDASKVSNPGWVGADRPTHVVLDCEGEIMGRGMDEDSAVADAIVRTLCWQRDSIEEYRTAIRNLRLARDALEKIA